MNGVPHVNATLHVNVGVARRSTRSFANLFPGKKKSSPAKFMDDEERSLNENSEQIEHELSPEKKRDYIVTG